MKIILEENGHLSTFHIFKNLIVLGISFFLLFSAFCSVQNLLSSLYPKYGFLSLCIIYVMFMISCLTIPPLLIKKIGEKYTLLLSMAGYLFHTASNFYPVLPVLLLGAFSVGLSAGPLWVAQGSYITTLATTHAESAKLNRERTITKFFSIFFLIFLLNQVAGNLISSMVLNGKDNTHKNATLNNQSLCGMGYCRQNSITAVNNDVEESSVNMLLVIYLVFGIAAMISTFAFLDGIKQNKTKEPTALAKFWSTCKLFRKRKMCCLIPLATYYGLQQAFAYGDFTSAYVSCSLGINNVGFIMICYGVTSGISSFALSVTVKWLGNAFLVAFGFFLRLSVMVWLLLWDKSHQLVISFYIAGGLLGVCEAVWAAVTNEYFLEFTGKTGDLDTVTKTIETYLRFGMFCIMLVLARKFLKTAICGTYFPDQKEAAFSQFKFWEATGCIILFACGNYLCTDIKIYILIGLLTIGFFCYIPAEILQRRIAKLEAYQKAKKKKVNDPIDLDDF